MRDWQAAPNEMRRQLLHKVGDKMKFQIGVSFGLVFAGSVGYVKFKSMVCLCVCVGQRWGQRALAWTSSPLSTSRFQFTSGRGQKSIFFSLTQSVSVLQGAAAEQAGALMCSFFFSLPIMLVRPLKYPHLERSARFGIMFGVRSCFSIHQLLI